MRCHLTWILLLALAQTAGGQRHAAEFDTVPVHIYKVNKHVLVPTPSVDSLVEHIDSVMPRLRHAYIGGSASPEGPVDNNWRLGYERGHALGNYLLQNTEITADLLEIDNLGEDWQGTINALQARPDFVNRAVVLQIIASEPDWATRKRKIQAIDNGLTWRRMVTELFGPLRNSRIILTLDPLKWLKPLPPLAMPLCPLAKPQMPELKNPEPLPPHYWALSSNMLHDLLLVPNIGLHAWLGKQWSLYGDYSGAWWGAKYRTHLWRYYGGNLELRRYLQKDRKPFTGWHVGVYGEFASYDFQFGIHGYQGKRCGGGGIIAGYMMPISKHFNIDFGLGVGYFGGKYRRCRYFEGCEIYDGTFMRHWWGPTRGEVTLVWLLGRHNINIRKSGGGWR